MRLIPVALILGLITSTSASSTPASAPEQQSFEGLGRRLHLGDRIRVEDVSGVTTTGRLTEVTVGRITIDTDAGPRIFQRDAVADVAVRRSYARLGALIGAGVGAALCIPCTTGSHPDADAPVLTGLLGAGAGAIVGALVPRMTVVYHAPGTPASQALAPEFSTGRAEIRIRLQW